MNYLTSRRAALLGVAAFLFTPAALSAASPVIQREIHVLKDPNCGCCTAWADILEDNGFAVSIEEISARSLYQFKAESGISREMMSCHTARIDGYLIEGHVPPADIGRLLEERPEAIGLAVPGMPYGSPGMGPASEREAYNVFLIRRNGTAEVFTHYEAA